mmetsp:Transcript_37443/g.89772  ORF Transcript_37443/g.89772 Transcript_37443/m.89772 type:complete len:259 (-) Transcript_37443:202-978(-)
MIPRRPLCFSARLTHTTMYSGDLQIMLPQPMYTGWLPAAMKADIASRSRAPPNWLCCPSLLRRTCSSALMTLCPMHLYMSGRSGNILPVKMLAWAMRRGRGCLSGVRKSSRNICLEKMSVNLKPMTSFTAWSAASQPFQKSARTTFLHTHAFRPQGSWGSPMGARLGFGGYACNFSSMTGKPMLYAAIRPNNSVRVPEMTRSGLNSSIACFHFSVDSLAYCSPASPKHFMKSVKLPSAMAFLHVSFSFMNFSESIQGP